MPSIKDAVGADLAGYQPAERPPVLSEMLNNNKPKANPMIRCPLPPFNSDPDTLRQFETGFGVPQIRVIPLPPATGASSTGLVAASTSASSSSGGSSASGLVAKTATLLTGVIGAGGSFVGSVAMAKSFQLLTLSVDTASEVRLYGSDVMQSFDQARLTDDPVPAEISSNIITDVVFDSAPYTWAFQNRVGVNQDATQTTTAYITVVNPGTTPISNVQVVVTFLPLES